MKTGDRVRTRAPAPVAEVQPAAAAAEPMRLSKRMAELGLCSRREADEWISRGWVFVDGVRTDVLGSKVLASQKISVTRAAEKESEQRVTIVRTSPSQCASGTTSTAAGLWPSSACDDT